MGLVQRTTLKNEGESVMSSGRNRWQCVDHMVDRKLTRDSNLLHLNTKHPFLGSHTLVGGVYGV